MVFGFEVLFLIVVARPPGQNAADVERLAQNMPDHVLRHHALRGAFVMRAPGGMDVMIARIPAELRDINPSFEFERVRLRPIRGDLDGLPFDQIFGPAREFDLVLACREFDLLAVRAIDLRVEIEIGRQPFEAWRIDAFLRVANDERRRRGLAVFVQHAERHDGRGPAVEENVHVIAEADVLCALAYVETDLRLTLAGVAAVKLDDAVFKLQSRQRGFERWFVEHRQVEPAVRHDALRDLLWRTRIATARGVDWQSVRAFRLELRRHAGFVAHLDQKGAPAFFDQLRRGRALRDPHAAFGVDVNVEEAVFVERVLNGSAGFRRVRFIARLLQSLSVRLFDRRAQIIHRFDQAPDLGRERLQIDLPAL